MERVYGVQLSGSSVTLVEEAQEFCQRFGIGNAEQLLGLGLQLLAARKPQLNAELFVFKVFRDAELDGILQLEFFESAPHPQLQIG